MGFGGEQAFIEAQKLMKMATRRILWIKKTLAADNIEALGKRLKMVGIDVWLLRDIAFE